MGKNAGRRDEAEVDEAAKEVANRTVRRITPQER